MNHIFFLFYRRFLTHHLQTSKSTSPNISSSNNSNSNDNAPKDTSKPPNKNPPVDPKKLPDDYRIPGAVQIGAVSTFGDVMSGKSTFKLQHTMENPTLTELHAHLSQKLEHTGPTEPSTIHNGTKASAVRLPNNGYPEGSCAGCGAEDGDDGGALKQCARCKVRKYCGRACQKGDWGGHRRDCVEG